jgi:acetyltransferase AlgX (SGNH hydrolase-like protein)
MIGRVARIALIVWVGCLLLLPVVGYALGFRGKNIDNRTLAKGPGWSLHTLTHSSAWHHAADAFSDHMPLRDRAIRWRSETEFKVFRDSPRPEVVIVGRDHWLFLHEEYDSCALYPTVPTAQVAQAFELARAVAGASGRELYTMLIPAKATIESDHYRTSQYTFEACPRAREQELERLLRGKPGMIDLWTPMRAAKRAGRDVFKPNDSHADTLGSILIAKALVQAVRPSAWEEGLEASGPAYPFVGDLDVLAGLTDTADAHELILHGTPKHPIRTPMLSLGDSQFDQSTPEIAPYFPTRQAASLDGMLSGGVDPALIRSARILVVESVVRDAFARVSAYFYPLQLIDALLPDIPRLPATYGDARKPAPLTLPAGVINTPIHAKQDDVGRWRLVVFTVIDAGTGLSVALVDADGAQRFSPGSARGALSNGSLVGMAIPPGIAASDVQLSVNAPAGAKLSPLEIAPLSPG